MKRPALFAVLLLVCSWAGLAQDSAPPYRVVDGNKVDAQTLAGWRTWRALACERCHGRNQQGLVGPSLVDSLKRLSKEEFKHTVLKGRIEKGMPNFAGSAMVVANFDGLYGFLKGRSDGAIAPGRLQELAPTTPSPGVAETPTGVLRVCADPNNLPLSHRNGQGFENKIAELLAGALGWQLEYTWYPQRMGFIRNTLRARGEGDQGYKCDLVIGLPVGFELAATTAPYYRSTWALVYLRGHGLDAVHRPDDLVALPAARLQSLRLGAFGQSPPVDWLLRHHLLDQMVPYQRQTGDPEQYPGEIVEKDLLAGKIDVAFVWGPIAGYFAGRDPARRLVVVPFPTDPEIKFDYAIAMGVRFGEKAWKERIDQVIDQQRVGIQHILASYGVPRLDAAGHLLPAGDLGGEVLPPPKAPLKASPANLAPR
jgi:quinoprotein dehydrogenase-associated probable ABC transporter substrate-binding protein